jgi:transposase
MGRRVQHAAAGFECSYERDCPYHPGWSAEGLWWAYQELEAREREQWGIVVGLEKELKRGEARIRELEGQNAQLHAQLRAIHEKQFKANRKEAAVQAPDGASRESAPPRKRGAPVGHPHWRRPAPETFDRTVEVPAPSQCPYCDSANLRELQSMREHWQEDIVLVPRLRATLFVHREAHCPQCGKNVIAWSTEQAGPGHIGPVAKSLAAYLRHDIGLTTRKTRAIFADLFGLPFAAASVIGFEKAGARRGETLYQDLGQKVRHSALVHADETHWREDGRNGFLWFAGNADLALYRMDPSRSSEAAQALLGSDFHGTLVSDGYAAYNSVGAKHRQSCLAHLIRHGKELAEEIRRMPPEHRDQRAAAFCDGAAALFREACHAANELIRTKREFASHAPPLLKRFERQLDSLCARPLNHERAETFRKRLVGKERFQWFEFLRRPGLPPTNNLAERAMRPAVIRRKTSFGTRSPHGSKTLAVLTSLVQTAKLQGRHPLRFLESLFSRSPDEAARNLYRNADRKR